MDINHGMIFEAIKRHREQSGHDVQYYDGGAEHKETMFSRVDRMAKDMKKERDDNNGVLKIISKFYGMRLTVRVLRLTIPPCKCRKKTRRNLLSFDTVALSIMGTGIPSQL